MRILGIDPGLNITGYGVIEIGKRRFKFVEAGVIKTPAGDGIEGRLLKLHTNLTALVEEHNPDVLVLEKLYAHYKHPTTALLMGHARGVACLVCGQKRVELASYSATRIKKAVVGKGHATKGQVSGMVVSLLDLKSVPKYNDVTDALAIAMSHAYIEGI